MSWIKPATKSVHEIRLHMCQTGKASSGLREYLNTNYLALKKAAGQDFPILIREAQGTPAQAFARFELGVEMKVSLEGLNAQEVESQLKQLLLK